MELKTGKDAHVFQHDSSCPYFRDGRISSLEYLFFAEGGSQDFHTFLASGYRRLGSIFYRNVCRGCSACKPIRVETQRFCPSKSQKRTLKKNSDIRLEIHSPAFISIEKIDLYRKYLYSKHGEGGDYETDNLPDHDASLAMMYYGYPETLGMDYYSGDRLIGAGIIDQAADALSSNYFYYDTYFFDRRLGVFSILREIALARLMQKKYVYLGFYIEETRKMSYKKFFRPNQILEKGQWKEFYTE